LIIILFRPVNEKNIGYVFFLSLPVDIEKKIFVCIRCNLYTKMADYSFNPYGPNNLPKSKFLYEKQIVE